MLSRSSSATSYIRCLIPSNISHVSQDTNRKDIFARNITNKVQYLEYIDSWNQGSRKMVKGCAQTTEHSFAVNRAGLLLCPRERVKGRFTTQHTTKSLVARSFFMDKPTVFGLEGFSGPS